MVGDAQGDAGGGKKLLYTIDVPYRGWDRFQVLAETFEDAMGQIVAGILPVQKDVGGEGYDYENAQDVSEDL